MTATDRDRSTLSARWQRGFDWLEAELGGRIVRFERQPRWRPAFDLDLERGGETLPLYWRGDRGTDEGINSVYTLEREGKILQVLERLGLPVPHVHAFCNDPLGVIMDRAPGRPNLATCQDEAERRAARDHYIELLVEMHAADTAPFEAIGLERPTRPDQLGLADLPLWEGQYRKAKRQPEPLVEFATRWVRANVPQGRSEVTFVAGDSGQFLFEAGRVTAIIDLELAYLGDPAADLGALFCRDLSEPFGDLSEAVRLYESLSGRALDPSVVRYHAARFMLVTPMATAHFRADPQPGLDVAQYTSWYLVYAQATLEVIAEAAGVELVAPSLPEPRASRLTPAARSLVASVEEIREGAGDDFRAYQAESALRLAQALERQDSHGAALEADDLADAARLLGTHPTRWSDADRALEELILAAPAERDGELLRFLYRHILRQKAIWQPALREFDGVRLQSLATGS
ncbi:MAG: aminoglycoside phosphotransferase [Deltaproteobacteria bacterium]|nr:aminoglycoside phosphotransferase [Deltaproteobacteria bacterium]